MKKIYLIALASALVCGLLVYMYFGSIEKRIAEAERKNELPPVEMGDIIVAVSDIPPNTRITEKMVAVESIPAEYIAENTAASLDQVIGLMSDGTIVSGQTIMASSVGELEDLYSNLSVEIPEGMRAMTFSIDTSGGVGGYVVPGDHVDMLGYIAPDPDQGIEEKCCIAIERALVLRTGDNSFDAGEDLLYSSMTLAVTQRQSLDILKLMETGDIYFTLYRAEPEEGGQQ